MDSSVSCKQERSLKALKLLCRAGDHNLLCLPSINRHKQGSILICSLHSESQALVCWVFRQLPQWMPAEI